MHTITKTDVGAAAGCLRISAIAVLLAAGAMLCASGQPAQAQFYPWGTWGNPAPWQPKQQRRVRRAPRYAEPPEASKPEQALPKPTGPLVLVVSINRQTVTVYDDGKVIAKSPISSGTRSNPTPTGIFSILEKNRTHYSNLYGGAPMPFMQRVTNSGVALHAGELPGYPASHGCIRLPYSFARSLFGITDIGARVIISDEDLTPEEFDNPRLIKPLAPDNLARAGATAVPASASGSNGDLSNMIGVSPAAAGNTGVRTRSMAAAERAAERERLVAAITQAEEGKAAAEAQVVAAAKAAQDGKELIRQQRAEAGKMAEAARKAQRASDAAADRFKDLTAKMAKLETDKLNAADLEKQSADEVAEETKTLDLADAARVAAKASDEQAAKAKQAVADGEALEKARKVAVEDAKHAGELLQAARDALAAADALEARKDYPVAVFISAKTGRLIAKLGFVEVLNEPVEIAEAGRPLGTHVMTALAYTDGEKDLRWSNVTLKSPSSPSYAQRKKRRHDDESFVARAGADADAAAALERIKIPQKTQEKLAELMKPGSSLIVSDYPLSRETSNRTEFVVEPWRSRGDSSEFRYY